MDIPNKYLEQTICAIESIIRYKYTSLITVKKIRKFYDVKSKDSSKINFYWRSLQALEETGILKIYEPKKPQRYQVLNFFKLQ